LAQPLASASVIGREGEAGAISAADRSILASVSTAWVNRFVAADLLTQWDNKSEKSNEYDSAKTITVRLVMEMGQM